MIKRTPLLFRQVLVIFQFAISIALIAGTVVVYRQLHYMKNKDLGLNQEQVVVIPLRDPGIIQKQETFKSQLLAESGILNVMYASRLLGTGARGTLVGREGAPPEQQVYMKFLFVEHDFIPALEIDMSAGRNFSKEFPADVNEAFVLNEKAVQDLGWKSPQEAIGQRLTCRRGEAGAIIGVVKNFHFQPMQVFMQPLVLHLGPQNMQTMMVRIDGQDIQTTMATLRRKWNEFVPNWPFVYSFMDQDFDNLYKSQEQFGQMFGNFTFLAILIACLGLFGLAAFSAERRKKEIGIRKVLGASSPGLVLLLSKEFTVLVGIATIIASPLAWYFMNRWLQNFSFALRSKRGYC
jgi:putative ABC transport system permease protein